MRSLAGLTLLLAGVGVGTYTYFPELMGIAPRQIAATESVVAVPQQVPPQPSSTPAASTEPRTFSPVRPLLAEPKEVVAKSAAEVATAVAKAPDASEPPRSWPAQVKLASPHAATSISPPKPGDYEARATLVREIQKELKRVGCYDGDIDGDWGPGSKRAISEFTQRVNATLPLQEPDYILLTLVQGHSARACGASCPTGQGLNPEGRCVPQAILAQADRKNAKSSKKPAEAQLAQKAAEERRLAEERTLAEKRRLADADNKAQNATTAEQARLAEQRAADARRLGEERRLAEERKASERRRLAQIANEQKANATAAAVAVTATATATAAIANEPKAPMPGRMTVGGPVAVVAPAPVAAPQPPPAAPAPTAADTNESGLQPARAGNGSSSNGNGNGNGGKSTAKPRPAPQAKPVNREKYAAPSYVGASKPSYQPQPTSSSARQKRLVYDLFQSVDRN